MIKTLLLSICLYLPNMSQAQVSPSVSKRYPAHIVYKIDDVLSKVKLSEDKQIKIAQKSLLFDSIANAGLAKGAPIKEVKNYIVIDKLFLKDILSVEEMEKYGFETNKDNRFLATLINAPLLKLEPSQISKIRQLNDSLDNTPKREAKETIGFYNTKLGKTLSKEQYVLLLKTIYKEQSIAEAKNDWDKIIKLKLVTDEKNSSEYNKIVNYHLTRNSFLDAKAGKYDNNKIEAVTNGIALQEPPVLIRANILSDGIYKNNNYASIIKFDKELQLTKIQIDTLLTKYNQLERIRFENKERELTLNSPKPVPSEYDNIAKILTSEQVHKWLVFKNQGQSTKSAIECWRKLETEGLTRNLDTNTTLKDLAIYQLKYLVAKEMGMIYNTKEIIFMKRDIEQNKPELLKQLDVINQTKSKNTTTKNALTW